jgi:mRNA interferase MazF
MGILTAPLAFLEMMLSACYIPRKDRPMYAKTTCDPKAICPKIYRGEIYYVDFNPTTGSEQGGLRPATVLSSDVGNATGPTAIVAPITSKPKPALATHVVLPLSSGLCLDSVLLLEQIRVVDKVRIGRYVGFVGTATLAEVDRALCASLGIEVSAGGKKAQGGVRREDCREGGVGKRERESGGAKSRRDADKPRCAATGRQGGGDADSGDAESPIQERVTSETIMTLCPQCLSNYENSEAFNLSRVNPNQRYKELCTRCSTYLGYDYVIEER